jgi:hypothetical protein
VRRASASADDERGRRGIDTETHAPGGSARFRPGDGRDLVAGAGSDHVPMPDEEAVLAWIRRNDAARAEDRRRGLERSMAERLEEAVRLSRLASELSANLGRDPDVRAR